MQVPGEHSGEVQTTPRKDRGKAIAGIVLKHGFLAGCALFLALLMFGLTMNSIIMPFYQGSGKGIALPNITGMTVPEAERLLRGKRLSVQTEKTDYHNMFPPGIISLQIPSQGTIVKPGRRIRVVVSKGPRPLLVPNIVGMSPRNARLAVQDAGLYVTEEGWVPSNEYPNGIVAGQDPAGEQEVPENTGVVLYISNGRRVTNIIMPNLINLSLSAAQDTLRAYNFNLDRLRIQREEQPDLLPDTIIEQYPDPGFPANTSDEVVLIVSKPE